MTVVSDIMAKIIFINIYIQEGCNDIVLFFNIMSVLVNLNTLLYILSHLSINIMNG